MGAADGGTSLRILWMDKPDGDDQTLSIPTDPILTSLISQGDAAQLEWVIKMRFKNPDLVVQLSTLIPRDKATFSKFIGFIYSPPLLLNSKATQLDVIAARCWEACGADPSFFEGCFDSYGTVEKLKEAWCEHDSPKIMTMKVLPNFFVEYLVDVLPQRVIQHWVPKSLSSEKKMTLFRKCWKSLIAPNNGSTGFEILVQDLPQKDLDEIGNFLLSNKGAKWEGFSCLRHLPGVSSALKAKILDVWLNEFVHLPFWDPITHKTIFVLQDLKLQVPRQTILKTLAPGEELCPFRLSRIGLLLEVIHPEAFSDITTFLFQQFTPPQGFLGGLADVQLLSKLLPIVMSPQKKSQFCQLWRQGYLAAPTEAKKVFLLQNLSEFTDEESFPFLTYGNPHTILVNVLRPKYKLSTSHFHHIIDGLPKDSIKVDDFRELLIAFVQNGVSEKFLAHMETYWGPSLNTHPYIGVLFEALCQNLPPEVVDPGLERILQAMVDSHDNPSAVKQKIKADWRSFSQKNVPIIQKALDRVISNSPSPTTVLAVQTGPEPRLELVDGPIIDGWIQNLQKNPFLGELENLSKFAHQLNEKQIQLCIQCAFLQKSPKDSILPFFQYMTLEQLKHVLDLFFGVPIQNCIAEDPLMWILELKSIKSEMLEEFGTYIMEKSFECPVWRSGELGRRIHRLFPHTIKPMCFKISKALCNSGAWWYLAECWLDGMQLLNPDERISAVSSVLLTYNKDAVFMDASFVKTIQELKVPIPEAIQLELIQQRLDRYDKLAQPTPYHSPTTRLSASGIAWLKYFLTEDQKKEFVRQVVERFLGSPHYFMPTSSDVNDLFPFMQPEHLVPVVLKNFHALHDFLPDAVSVVPSNEHQEALVKLMIKEYLRNQHFPTKKLESVFSVLHGHHKQKLSNMIFENISLKKIQSFDLVPLVKHVDSIYFEHMLPFVPPSIDFYEGLKIDKDLFHAWVLFVLRTQYEIPIDVLRLIFKAFRNWTIQSEYLHKIVSTIPRCGSFHLNKYIIPFFGSPRIPDSVKPQVINLMLSRRLYGECKFNQIPWLLDQQSVGNMLHAYLGFQHMEDEEERLRRWISRELKPRDAPIVTGLVTGGSIKLEVYYSDGNEEHLGFPLVGPSSKWQDLVSAL